MLDGLWNGLLVASMIGIWIVVVLMALLYRLVHELLAFLKHKAFLDHLAEGRVELAREYARRDAEWQHGSPASVETSL